LSLIPLGQLSSDFTYPTYVNFQSKVQRTGGKDTEQYVNALNIDALIYVYIGIFIIAYLSICKHIYVHFLCINVQRLKISAMLKQIMQPMFT
jgi:hypothetical protein